MDTSANVVITPDFNTIPQTEIKPTTTDIFDTRVRLLHLTDLHLFADADVQLLGQNTRLTFHSVLNWVQCHHWPVSAILLTGDLVHDENIATYRYLGQYLKQLGCPYYCLPGNHDRVDLVAGLLDPYQPSRLHIIELEYWDLILLDSTIPSESSGYLAPSSLAQLEAHLIHNERRPTLVALHHHPIASGSQWLDALMVYNGNDLLSIIDRYPQVRVVVWGHTHQQFDGQCGHSMLFSTPSTCVQFLPYSQNFALDTLTPGYRWIDLYSDGQVKSGVERIPAYPDPVQLDSLGY
ncbi:metallophosphoesterase [Rhodoferax sp. 4810]|uniref:Metallophosphoesterase n=1 Tax=Thiospirillum jenense TaxID=1653858 RepID=A0A839HC64_9GAMM|nr:metallophosphoesterase [Thiospirillum jenense]MBB1076327.1 metallophosphoesterase [Rhodoferax jenense]MBB1126261.1 metallophosphoesterase [Thiospirillum jenense]